MRLREVARAIGGAVRGGDIEFDAVATDSRALPASALFVALRGERFDGHAFAARALEQGAAAVMIEACAGLDLAPAIVVDDTRLALGRLAAWHRGRMPARRLAITGSNGKTSVKEMSAAILRAEAGEAAVLATQGNLNNDIGVPLTLLRLNPGHRYAVIEMGMNHAGEIDYLTRLAQPDVALVNNAMRAHLEGLGSVETIARAKGEIYAGLTPDGVALINLDDPHTDLWQGLCQDKRVLTFGLSAQADVHARAWRLEPLGTEIDIVTPAGALTTRLAAPGLHNVRNAVAATAAAHALGVAPEVIGRGLAAWQGTRGRLQVHPCILGARLIDDSYNANPDSVAAAIEVLAAQTGTRILVLGDMGELGPDGRELHAEIGIRARAAGIDRLFCLGELSAAAAAAFGPGGMHFERIEELLAEIECALAPDVTVLIKGSRFMKMERVVQSFLEAGQCS